MFCFCGFHRNKRGMTPFDIAVTETMKDALKAYQSPSVSPNEKTSVMKKGSKCVDVVSKWSVCKYGSCSTCIGQENYSIHCCFFCDSKQNLLFLYCSSLLYLSRHTPV